MGRFQELELDPRIERGLDEAGFVGPFPIQERVIRPLLRRRDVIGQAKAGTGKTAAYGLPMLQLMSVRSRDVQGLVLAPTRELAVQIAQEIRRLGRYTGVKVVAIYGGQSINIQLKALAHGVQIVVGTPGRVIDLIKRGELLLDTARFVVLDEADTMLDMGFIDDVEFILDSVSKERQLSLFSATMPERIIQLADRYMRRPERILVDSDEPSVETLDQYYTVAEGAEKLNALLEILNKEKPFSAIIFCATRDRTHRLARELERRRYSVASLHGNLSQHQRDRAMSLFRSRTIDLLVATDIAGRGIDVPNVACVVNYDVPKYPLVYFHRVGRTARAGESGKSFTLVSSMEFRDFMRIKDLTAANIKPLHPRDTIEKLRTRRSHTPTAANDVRRRRHFYRRSGRSRRQSFSNLPEFHRNIRF